MSAGMNALICTNSHWYADVDLDCHPPDMVQVCPCGAPLKSKIHHYGDINDCGGWSERWEVVQYDLIVNVVGIPGAFDAEGRPIEAYRHDVHLLRRVELQIMEFDPLDWE